MSCTSGQEKNAAHNLHQCGMPVETYRKVIALVVKSSACLPTSLPLLRQQKSQAIALSQLQCAVLVSLMFFGLLPDMVDGDDVLQLPSTTSFAKLLFGKAYPSSIAKLQCILKYLDTIIDLLESDNYPLRHIVFERSVLTSNEILDVGQYVSPESQSSPSSIQSLVINFDKFQVVNNELIQDSGSDWIKVDFANEYIGGGVLGRGAVQEEILFCEHPELLVSMLMCERMDDNEAILIRGVSRYTRTKGYASSLQFGGLYHDMSPLVSLRAKGNTVLFVKDVQFCAIDAMYFHQGRDNVKPQCQMKYVQRELNKAFAGFQESNAMQDQDKGIATGNWGCGVFGGDIELKFLIQLIAAILSGRQKFKYHQFDSSYNLYVPLDQMYNKLMKNRVIVAHLLQSILRFNQGAMVDSITSIKKNSNSSIFKHVIRDLNLQ
ncbi:hypothetical protein MIR68_006874 [Amoeboaphelidium protococcarum]|nr:hypothetical protein MIR68_006874 [Amoeboaphelidium protococcarum]